MKKLVAILVLLLASCADLDTVSKPDPFYGDDKMASIFVDLYLMESSMTSNRGMFASLKTLPDDFIYSKYETDSTTFAQNLAYYTDDGPAYKSLLEIVEQRIKVLKDTVAARQKLKAQKTKRAPLSNDVLLEIDPDDE